MKPQYSTTMLIEKVRSHPGAKTEHGVGGQNVVCRWLCQPPDDVC